MDGSPLSDGPSFVPQDVSVGRSVFDLLASLIDKSLLRQEAGAGSEPRFLMLETVREFGIERLGEAGEELETRRRHAVYYLALVERWSPDPVLPGEKRRLGAIAAEYDNVRLALVWFDEQDDAGGLLQLTGRLFEYWFARGLYTEGRQWMRRALGRGETGDPSVRLRALTTAGSLAQFQGDVGEATPLVEGALSLARVLGNAGQLVTALINSGLLAYHQGRLAQAETLLEEARDVARSFGEARVARALAGVALNNLATIAFTQGRLDRAAAMFEEAIVLLRASDYTWALDDSLSGLGGVCYLRGDAGRAALLVAEALLLARSVQDPRMLASALLVVAGVAAARGRPDVGARVLGAAEAVSASIGAPFAPSNRLVYDRCLPALNAGLGEGRLTEEREAGRALTIEQAALMAYEVVRANDAGAGKVRAGTDLTAREIEVLRLLVEGRSNAEIAAALFVAAGTVKTHVASILAKLGAPTRAAASTYAVRRGLV